MKIKEEIKMTKKLFEFNLADFSKVYVKGYSEAGAFKRFKHHYPKEKLLGSKKNSIIFYDWAKKGRAKYLQGYS